MRLCIKYENKLKKLRNINTTQNYNTIQIKVIKKI